MAATAANIYYEEWSTPTSPQATASSFSVTNGKPLTISVQTDDPTASPTPTVASSLGFTCTQIATVETNGGAVRRRVTVFEAYPSSSSTTTLTITIGGTPATMAVSVEEWTGADTTDYSVQSNTGVGNASGAQTVALTTPTAGNSVFLAAVINNSSGLTAGSGYTGLTVETIITGGTTTSFLTEYLASNDSTVDFSITGATNRRYAAVAVEIKAAAAAGVTMTLGMNIGF